MTTANPNAARLMLLAKTWNDTVRATQRAIQQASAGGKDPMDSLGTLAGHIDAEAKAQVAYETAVREMFPAREPEYVPPLDRRAMNPNRGADGRLIRSHFEDPLVVLGQGTSERRLMPVDVLGVGIEVDVNG